MAEHPRIWKHHKGQSITEFTDDLDLREEIDRTRMCMEAARNHFEQVTDPTLIDCYIYEINAAQLRYQFLLRCFKNLEDEEYEYLV